MEQSVPTKFEALLDEHQAASLMALSVRTLQAWRTRGDGPPFVRLGRAVRYRRSDIIGWLDARVMVSTHHTVRSFAAEN